MYFVFKQFLSDKPIQPHTEPLNLRMAGLPQAGAVDEIRNGDAIRQVGQSSKERDHLADMQGGCY